MECRIGFGAFAHSQGWGREGHRGTPGGRGDCISEREWWAKGGMDERVGEWRGARVREGRREGVRECL